MVLNGSNSFFQGKQITTETLYIWYKLNSIVTWSNNNSILLIREGSIATNPIVHRSNSLTGHLTPVPTDYSVHPKIHKCQLSGHMCASEEMCIDFVRLYYEEGRVVRDCVEHWFWVSMIGRRVIYLFWVETECHCLTVVFAWHIILKMQLGSIKK